MTESFPNNHLNTIPVYKFHPRTGHEDPDWQKRSNCTLSLTSALDGVGWSTPRLGRFTVGKDPVPIA